MVLSLFAMEGGKWRTAAKFEGILVISVVLLAVFLSTL
jgi:prepilin signal peptidase PulO-like enzyme (type II secretory pathway)